MDVPGNCNASENSKVRFDLVLKSLCCPCSLFALLASFSHSFGLSYAVGNNLFIR